jgi:hypothetical protein
LATTLRAFSAAFAFLPLSSFAAPCLAGNSGPGLAELPDALLLIADDALDCCADLAVGAVFRDPGFAASPELFTLPLSDLAL